LVVRRVGGPTSVDVEDKRTQEGVSGRVFSPRFATINVFIVFMVPLYGESM